MAKVQKYSDSLLLEAVIKYADQYPGKIYASRLANWASLNVPGLEEVREYMFLRPLIVKDPKTGKQKQRLRPCTERITAINASRTLSSNIKSNILLHSSTLFLQHFLYFLLLPQGHKLFTPQFLNFVSAHL